METLLYVGQAPHALPEGRWNILHASHPLHAMRICNAEAPAAIVVALEKEQRHKLLQQVRGACPTVPRAALLPGDEAFDIDAARLVHEMSVVPTSQARWASLVDRLLDGTGLSPLPSGLSVDDLPMLPKSATELLEALDHPDITLFKATQLIGQDPALASRVLSLANSAFYGLPRRVSRLQDAASFLGLATLRRTVLASQVFACFKKVKDQAAVETIRANSVLRMGIARIVTGVSDEEAATAALLADVGRLAQLALGHSPTTLLFPNSRDLGAEAELHGTDHGLLGGVLLREWGMPAGVVQAVAHATWSWPHPVNGLNAVSILRIADGLAAEVRGEPNTLDPAWVKAMGLEKKLFHWRADVADLAMQWPAA